MTASVLILSACVRLFACLSVVRGLRYVRKFFTLAINSTFPQSANWADGLALATFWRKTHVQVTVHALIIVITAVGLQAASLIEHSHVPAVVHRNQPVVNLHFIFVILYRCAWFRNYWKNVHGDLQYIIWLLSECSLIFCWFFFWRLRISPVMKPFSNFFQ